MPNANSIGESHLVIQSIRPSDILLLCDHASLDSITEGLPIKHSGKNLLDVLSQFSHLFSRYQAFGMLKIENM